MLVAMNMYQQKVWTAAYSNDCKLHFIYTVGRLFMAPSFFIGCVLLYLLCPLWLFYQMKLIFSSILRQGLFLLFYVNSMDV